jgi:hypothetical protein
MKTFEADGFAFRFDKQNTGFINMLFALQQQGVNGHTNIVVISMNG